MDITFEVVASIKGSAACIVSVTANDGKAASAAKAVEILKTANKMKKTY